MSGDGLVAPLNAPPAGHLVPGVQPGTSNAVVIANIVIIFGPSGSPSGLFVYKPGTTPGAGNPPVSWSSASSTDPYGNTLTPAVSGETAVVGAGQDGAAQVTLVSRGAAPQAGLIEFPVPGTFFRYGSLAAAVENTTGSTLFLLGPADTSQEAMALELLSKTADGTSAAWQIIYFDPNGVQYQQAFGTFAGVTLPAASVTAIEPGVTTELSPASGAQWHTLALTTVTGSGNGVNGFRYKVMPGNMLLLEWDLAMNSVANNITIATIPAGWRPSKAHNIGSGTYGTSATITTAANPHFTVNTNGTIVTGGQAAVAFNMCGTAIIGLD